MRMAAGNSWSVMIQQLLPSPGLLLVPLIPPGPSCTTSQVSVLRTLLPTLPMGEGGRVREGEATSKERQGRTEGGREEGEWGEKGGEREKR